MIIKISNYLWKKERTKDLKKKIKLVSETPTSKTQDPVDKKVCKNLSHERSDHMMKQLMYPI